MNETSNKYHAAQAALAAGKTYTFKAYGNSMLPILKSGSTLTFKAQAEYNVGDIVFCKVRGRFIDAHKITKKAPFNGGYRYMIANNHGHENGWTRQIYGKVIHIIQPNEPKKSESK